MLMLSKSRVGSIFRSKRSLAVPGISVAAPIRRSTPWAFIRKNFPFVPTIEMSTLFSFPSKNQINTQGAVTENPGSMPRASHDIVSDRFFFIFITKQTHRRINDVMSKQIYYDVMFSDYLNISIKIFCLATMSD